MLHVQFTYLCSLCGSKCHGWKTWTNWSSKILTCRQQATSFTHVGVKNIFMIFSANEFLLLTSLVPIWSANGKSLKVDLSLVNLILTRPKPSITLTSICWRLRSNNRTNMCSKPHACWQTLFLIPNLVKPNWAETDINSYDKCEVFDGLELSGLRSNFFAPVMSLLLKCV